MLNIRVHNDVFTYGRRLGVGVVLAVCAFFVLDVICQGAEKAGVRFAIENMTLEGNFEVKGYAYRLSGSTSIAPEAKIRSVYKGMEYVLVPASNELHAKSEEGLPAAYFVGSVAWPKRWLEPASFLADYAGSINVAVPGRDKLENFGRRLSREFEHVLAGLSTKGKFKQEEIDDKVVLLSTEGVKGGQLELVLFLSNPLVGSETAVRVHGGGATWVRFRDNRGVGTVAFCDDGTKASRVVENFPVQEGFKGIAPIPLVGATAENRTPLKDVALRERARPQKHAKPESTWYLGIIIICLALVVGVGLVIVFAQWKRRKLD